MTPPGTLVTYTITEFDCHRKSLERGSLPDSPHDLRLYRSMTTPQAAPRSNRMPVQLKNWQMFQWLILCNRQAAAFFTKCHFPVVFNCSPNEHCSIFKTWAIHFYCIDHFNRLQVERKVIHKLTSRSTSQWQFLEVMIRKVSYFSTQLTLADENNKDSVPYSQYFGTSGVGVLGIYFY